MNRARRRQERLETVILKMATNAGWEPADLKRPAVYQNFKMRAIAYLEYYDRQAFRASGFDEGGRSHDPGGETRLVVWFS